MVLHDGANSYLFIQGRQVLELSFELAQLFCPTIVA